MCSVILLRRPGHKWPLLIGANRDEMLSRPWKRPGRHWPDRPDVIAGLDVLADGSWLGINDNGVVAAMLNRHGTLGPQSGKRSRGELVLEALDFPDADEAAAVIAAIEPSSYRDFNMVIADNRDAFWLRHDGMSITAQPIPIGISMLTAHELNDRSTPRIAANLPTFEEAPPPDPETGDWSSWIDILARRAGDRPEEAMTIVTDTGYGTSSSALIALPSIEARHEDPKLKPIFMFAAGRPGEAPYEA